MANEAQILSQLLQNMQQNSSLNLTNETNFSLNNEMPMMSQEIDACEEEEYSNSDDFDKEVFLETLRQFKCLWDTNDPTFTKEIKRSMRASNFHKFSKKMVSLKLYYLHFVYI